MTVEEEIREQHRQIEETVEELMEKFREANPMIQLRIFGDVKIAELAQADVLRTLRTVCEKCSKNCHSAVSPMKLRPCSRTITIPETSRRCSWRTFSRNSIRPRACCNACRIPARISSRFDTSWQSALPKSPLVCFRRGLRV